MINKFNVSTAADVGRISALALSNPLFAKIVRTKKYKCATLQPRGFDEANPGCEFVPRVYMWDNTNKLLWK